MSRIISFIIPCYNGSYVIRKCLNSIQNQIIPVNYEIEIIVVDNNSKDDSIAIIQGEFPKVTLVTETEQGRSQARNKGVKVSRGEYLAFIDVDVELPDDWLSKILQSSRLNSRWGIITSVIKKEQMMESWFETYRVRAHTAVNSLATINRFVPYVNTAAIMTRKSVYNQVNGFDDCFDYFEDLDFGRKVALKGYSLIASDALVSCYFGLDWKATYFHRCFKMGFMSYRYLYKWNNWKKNKCFYQALMYYLTSIAYVWKNFIRLDYTLFQTFCFLCNMTGVIYSRLVDVGHIIRVKLSKGSWIRIYAHDKIQFVDIYDGEVKMIKR